MRFTVFIFIILCFIILLTQSVYSEKYDLSYTQNEYIKLGMPEKLKSLEDYRVLFSIFQGLEKRRLPKYDSKKSGNLFNTIFNKELVDSIIQKKISPLEKREILSGLSDMYSDFAGLYLMNDSRFYFNERARVSFLSTYSRVSTFEVMDFELEEKKITLPDEKILFITKMIGRDIWAIEFNISKKEYLDKDTID